MINMLLKNTELQNSVTKHQKRLKTEEGRANTLEFEKEKWEKEYFSFKSHLDHANRTLDVQVRELESALIFLFTMYRDVKQEFNIFAQGRYMNHGESNPAKKSRSFCQKCGTTKVHAPRDCPAQQNECGHCNRTGHFTAMCRYQPPGNLNLHRDFDSLLSQVMDRVDSVIKVTQSKSRSISLTVRDQSSFKKGRTIM